MKRWCLIIAALCLLLCGCGQGRQGSATDTVFAMDTVMTLTVYDSKGGEQAGAVLAEAETLVRELEGQLSTTEPDSALSKINRDGSGVLPAEAGALLAGALDLCAETEGALDVTIYPVSLAWGFTREDGDFRIPDRALLDSLLECVDYTRVRLDSPKEDGSRYVELAPGMLLDLGAVAKGWTGDTLGGLIRQRLGEQAHALLDLGGNVVAVGTKPDGVSPWRVGIRDPKDENNLAGVVEAVDKTVVTSGGYERFFERGGIRYWHILDPADGMPARSGLASVTVVGGADSGMRCDAYSTALFVMGAEKAADFWMARPEERFELIMVTQDGGLLITEGLEQQFSPAGDYRNTTVEIIRREA